jgi:PIN domain nuclease of toxin-antitoxin system
VAAIDAAVLMASWFLLGKPPRDPVERILLATARTGGYRLMTRDAEILGYARQGHLGAVAC